MRLDDLCLVNTDVTASDDYYRLGVGLERRFRNERFVDFLLGDGPRLAAWMRPSIGVTLGDSYPTVPGAPFRITIERPVDAPVPRAHLPFDGGNVLVDPDAFHIVTRPAAATTPRIVSVDLAVTDLAASRRFLTTLGFTERRGQTERRGLADPDGAVAAFDAGAVALTLVEKSSIDPSDATWSQTGSHLMLAIELDTGEAVDATHELLRERGLPAAVEPGGYEWGSRSVFYVDPDAFIWEIYAWVGEPR